MKKIPVRNIRRGHRRDFDIQDIGEKMAGKDMVQELHRHDFFYVLALEKGAGEHEIDFTPYPVENHTIFFLRPGQVHQLRVKAGSTGWMMQFTSGFYRNVQLLRRIGAINTYPDREGKALRVLAGIFREYQQQEEQYREVIQSSLHIFLVTLLRLQHQPAKDSPNIYTEERLEALLELLETHIHTHKRASQYAAMLHLSLYQLNAVTREALGKTASELIHEQIVLEAKRQLLATTAQISQIAAQLGYEDVSYFIRFFKKQTGYTPEAFRNKKG
ncbi:AraC family transcriptional regulator [Chitinophaga varians]|uniref:AraC family transcriptional regulator n=1 Tax=Chitinophaga varians TaxID=2202339 RepID=UPI00165EDAF8|nr:helix-turn-helix transcriptional regulator [Chitinophaga varians]MBC9912577.1 helix-turn-helix domain-containing protein [Chitinophaga varians]